MSQTLYCSFCGKSQHEVECLVEGPSTFICDECVEICKSIIEERRAKAGLSAVEDALAPELYPLDLTHAESDR